MVTPLTELSRHGHLVTLNDQGKRPPRKEDFLEGGWDVVVGQRLSNYDGMMLWRRTRLRGSRLAYELDDDIWNVTPDNFQAYLVYQDKPLREAVKAYMEISDVVTATTEYLADVFRAFNPNVAVLPNCVPGWVLDLPKMNEGDPGRRPRIGWVGAASHGRDVNLAAPGIRRFLRKNQDWDLYLAGSDFRSAFKVPVDQSHFAGWTQVNDDPEGFYRSYDFEIGIVPVLNTAFARSKSCVKALEMGARGIPVIASDIEPYREFVTHGVNGFLVRTDSEWLKYARLLAGDDELRRKMGEAAWETAKLYTIENRWQEWERVYEGLLK